MRSTSRIIGESQVVEAADRLIANTAEEGAQLVDLYGADPAKVRVINPGVDLDRFTPGSRAASRARLGLPADALVLTFVGPEHLRRSFDVQEDEDLNEAAGHETIEAALHRARGQAADLKADPEEAA